MYNRKFKEEFLLKQEGTSVVPVYRALFNKSAETEERVEKDLYDFNRRQIDVLYYSIGTPSVKTLEVFHSLIIRYVNYAISQGYRNSNVNLYDTISSRELEQYVAYYKHQFLTKKEFDEFMKYVVNDMDVAIYRSLFEGIGGARYSELTNLKLTDIKGREGEYYVTLTEDRADGTSSERELPITDELYKDLRRAYHQESYFSNNGEAELHTTIDIVDSPYIFRPLKKGAYLQSGGQINMQTIYRKKTLLNELTDGKVKNTNTIVTSGMLHQAALLHKEIGRLTDEDCIELGNRFNKNISSPYPTQKAKHIRNILRQGLKERYNIEV